MPIVCDSALYSVVREEHLFHNDFFLRYLDFVDEPVPEELIFTCFAGEKPCYSVRYEGEEIERRFRYGEEETARYRRSSLPRILGRSTRLQNPFLHEYFSCFCSEIVDRLVVKAKCGGKFLEKEIEIVPYESPNRYRFPLRGTVLVSAFHSRLEHFRTHRFIQLETVHKCIDSLLTHPISSLPPPLERDDSLHYQ